MHCDSSYVVLFATGEDSKPAVDTFLKSTIYGIPIPRFLSIFDKIRNFIFFIYQILYQK